MKQRNRIPAATAPQRICGRAEAANAAAVSDLRQPVGAGTSRAQLRPGRAVEPDPPLPPCTGGEELSHPLSMVDVMRQHNGIPAPTALQEICGWAEAATAAAVPACAAWVGDGASREQLGRAAETLRRMEAQMSSLKCDLAGRLQRTDGGAGAGEVLRDQLGMRGHGAKSLSQVSRRLEEMTNTRAKLQTGEITLASDAPLPPYTGGKKCHTPFLRWTL